MKRISIVIGATLLLALVGCGTSRRDTPFTGPLSTSGNDQLARGEVAFMAHCNQCHPGGGAGLGPAINDKPLPAWLIRAQIRSGLGEMPGFNDEQISDEDVAAIAAYLKALRGLEPRTAAEVAAR